MAVALTTRKRNPKLMSSCASETWSLLKICTHQGDYRLESFFLWLLFSQSTSLLSREAEGQKEIKKKEVQLGEDMEGLHC